MGCGWVVLMWRMCMSAMLFIAYDNMLVIYCSGNRIAMVIITNVCEPAGIGAAPAPGDIFVMCFLYGIKVANFNNSIVFARFY